MHRPRYDDWSLPKGKADDGESDEETALREVEEETGLRCVLGEPAGEPATGLQGSGQDRAVLADGADGHRDLDSSPTTRSTRCGGARSPRRPSASPTRTTASCCQGAGPVVTLYLVRHAQAGSRHRWKADDSCARCRRSGSAGRRHRPATSAEAADRIVVSSPFLRCRGPSSRWPRSSGSRSSSPTRSPKALASQTLRLVEKLLDQDVVLCTHGDVLQDLLDHFGRTA